MASEIHEEYTQIFSDDNVSLFACMHTAVLINQHECWKFDSIVYNDSEIECYASLDTCESRITDGIEGTAECSTRRKSSRKKCSALGCDCPEGSFFAFPAFINNQEINENNLYRCRQWVQNSGNRKLLEKPSSDLHVQNFLCSKHFDESLFTNKMRKRLNHTAVPTIFSFEPLTDEMLNNFPVNRKSQGLTMDKAVIDIGTREMQCGLTYVALSRVKTLEGLLLKRFPFSRLNNINRSKLIPRRLDWMKALVEHDLTNEVEHLSNALNTNLTPFETPQTPETEGKTRKRT